MRRPLIVGAQKLYLSLKHSQEFAEQLVKGLRDKDYPFDIAICPSFVNLAHVSDILRKDTRIGIGAQNVHQEDTGAFTGQVSIRELIDVGVRYVTVGHSELRAIGETNGKVAEKVRICLKHRVIPIACVGENADQRERGESEKIVEGDVKDIFANIPPVALEDDESLGIEHVVIAYEPVWAIKAGRQDNATASARPTLANEMHDFIRSVVSAIYGSDIAEKVRILYGGSVDPGNAGDLLKEPSIDGLLVGTASVNLDSFLKILEVAKHTVSEETLSVAERR